MKLKNARQLGPSELYERRKQAVIMHKNGSKYVDIAPVVGANRNAVAEWIKIWKDKGVRALKPKNPGRPTGSGRTLSQEEEKDIKKCITDRFPDQLKMDFALWTRGAVRQLIYKRYGIDMPVRTVGWYLQRWGFTPQKPVRRAYERSEPAVIKWLQEEYPEIKEKARLEGAEIHWGDETGLRSDDVNGRGYSPQGVTPVRKAKGSRESINMISTVTNQGKVRFMFYEQNLNADTFLVFLRRLIRSTDGRKVYLVLDNLRVHHSVPVKKWVEKKSDRIALFFLPSYSPDLNPAEYLNCDLKGKVSEKPDSRRKGGLAKISRTAMKSIQKQPKRVKKYFEHKSIAYAR